MAGITLLVLGLLALGGAVVGLVFKLRKPPCPDNVADKLSKNDPDALVGYELTMCGGDECVKLQKAQLDVMAGKAPFALRGVSGGGFSETGPTAPPPFVVGYETATRNDRDVVDLKFFYTSDAVAQKEMTEGHFVLV